MTDLESLYDLQEGLPRDATSAEFTIVVSPFKKDHKN